MEKSKDLLTRRPRDQGVVGPAILRAERANTPGIAKFAKLEARQFVADCGGAGDVCLAALKFTLTVKYSSHLI